MLIEIHILQNVRLEPFLADGIGASHACTYGSAKRAWISHFDMERSLRRCKMPEIDASGTRGRKTVCTDAVCSECRVPALEAALYGKSASPRGRDVVEPAVHAAHVISTDTIEESIDFFCAADDLDGAMDSAAETHTSVSPDRTICCYRYFSIDLDSLADNLACQPAVHQENGRDGKSATTLDVACDWFFSRLFEPSIFSEIIPQLGPSTPECVLIEARPFPIPVSYATAFERPGAGGIAGNPAESAMRRMLEHAKKVAADYNLPGRERLLLAPAYMNVDIADCKCTRNAIELLNCLGHVVNHG
jgi:hypothetical protein